MTVYEGQMGKMNYRDGSHAKQKKQSQDRGLECTGQAWPRGMPRTRSPRGNLREEICALGAREEIRARKSARKSARGIREESARKSARKSAREEIREEIREALGEETREEIREEHRHALHQELRQDIRTKTTEETPAENSAELLEQSAADCA